MESTGNSSHTYLTSQPRGVGSADVMKCCSRLKLTVTELEISIQQPQAPPPKGPDGCRRWVSVPLCPVESFQEAWRWMFPDVSGCLWRNLAALFPLQRLSLAVTTSAEVSFILWLRDFQFFLKRLRFSAAFHSNILMVFSSSVSTPHRDVCLRRVL